MFLDALVERLGASAAVFADLFDSNDPEAPVTVPGSFYELPADASPASIVVDDGELRRRAVRAAGVRLECGTVMRSVRDGTPSS